ncbi:unnamed protein product, partial [Mesorhabditis spiculigera]
MRDPTRRPRSSISSSDSRDERRDGITGNDRTPRGSTTASVICYPDEDDVFFNGSDEYEGEVDEAASGPQWVTPVICKTHYTAVSTLCDLVQKAINMAPKTGISTDKVFEYVYYTQAVRMTAIIETDFLGFLKRHIITGEISADLKDGVLTQRV